MSMTVILYPTDCQIKFTVDDRGLTIEDTLGDIFKVQTNDPDTIRGLTEALQWHLDHKVHW